MKLGIITSALFLMAGCAAAPKPVAKMVPAPAPLPPPNAHVVFCSGDPFSCAESADLVCSPTEVTYGRDTQHPKPGAWHQWGTEQREDNGQWSLTIVCDSDSGS